MNKSKLPERELDGIVLCLCSLVLAELYRWDSLLSSSRFLEPTTDYSRLYVDHLTRCVCVDIDPSSTTCLN